MEYKYYALKIVGVTFVVFLMQIFIAGFTDLFLLTPEAWTQPWRFITPIFLHGDIAHFFYNMFGLALFGSILEKIIGSKRFLLIYLGIGILGNLFGVFLYPRSLGASGAIYGILGLLAVMRPNMQVFVMYFPMPMWMAAVVWFLIDFAGIFAPSGTANAIHIIGLIAGLAIGFYMKRQFNPVRKYKNIEIIDPNAEDFSERRMRDWEDEHMRRR